MKLFILTLIGILPFLSLGEKTRYDNHQIWSLHIETVEQLTHLHEVMENDQSLSFWKMPQYLGQTIEIVVPPSEVERFKVMVAQYQFKNRIMNENLQDLIDNEQPKTRSAQFNFDRYRDVNELYAWLDKICEEHSKVAEVITIGYSWENRPIKGVKIDFGRNAKKSSIIIEAGIHAIEWVTYETSAWIINHLLNGGNSTDLEYMRQFTWYILPTVNPDGLQYTHEVTRMWRKTRSQHPGDECIGTDANRNFDFSWNMGGASNNSCAQNYMGPNPFSEKESQAISDFVTGIQKDVEVYLSFHSYGQYIIYPYGHTNDRFDNYDNVVSISQKAAATLEAVYGTKMITGTAPEVLYPTSGGSRDWAKGKMKIPISVAYEMRDKGEYGFLLPADQIVPNAQEIFASLVTLCTEGQKLKYLPFEARADSGASDLKLYSLKFASLILAAYLIFLH